MSPANLERNGFQNARRKRGQWFIWGKGERTIATSRFNMSVLNMLLLNKIKSLVCIHTVVNWDLSNA